MFFLKRFFKKLLTIDKLSFIHTLSLEN